MKTKNISNKGLISKGKVLVVLLIISAVAISFITYRKQHITPTYGDVKGFLWQVEKDGTTAYLYGSIHLGKSTIYPLAKEVEEAFNESSTLMVEIDLTNTTEIQQANKYAYYSENDNIYNHLSNEGKEKIESNAKEQNLDLETYKNLKPFAFNALLESRALLGYGYEANYGIDMYFTNKAKKSKKNIVSVETPSSQSELLDSFSEAEAEKFFISTLKSQSEYVDRFDKVYEDFIKADEESATINTLGEYDKELSFYQKLIFDRNIEMTSDIEEALNTDSTHFVVFGLGHFLGEDGIINMLKDKGYSVTPL